MILEATAAVDRVGSLVYGMLQQGGCWHLICCWSMLPELWEQFLVVSPFLMRYGMQQQGGCLRIVFFYFGSWAITLTTELTGSTLVVMLCAYVLETTTSVSTLWFSWVDVSAWGLSNYLHDLRFCCSACFEEQAVDL